MGCLVQLEFFHVGGEITGNLDALFAECEDRRKTGSPIKRVIRFIDSSGFTLEYIEKWRTIHQEMRTLKGEYAASTGLRRFLLALRYWRVLRQDLYTRELIERLEFAKALFLHAIHRGQETAVEKEDHTFRRMEDNERYDLETAILKAKGVWIFLFSPNELCSDTNTLIETLM